MKIHERLFLTYAEAIKAARGAYKDGYNIQVILMRDADGDAYYLNRYWKRETDKK